MVSCGSHKNVSTAVVDKNVEIYQRALQRSRDQFYAMDSANAIAQDLGWAKRIVKEAKISGNAAIPSVFKIVDDESFTIELPCWEFETDGYSNAYQSVSVLVEHNQLDSALIKAKMQGVEDLFSQSETRVASHYNADEGYMIDSIEFVDNYADYIGKAQFSCLCIMKQKKKYIINATIRIPNKNYITEDEIIPLPFNEALFHEEIEKAMQQDKKEKAMQRYSSNNHE